MACHCTGACRRPPYTCWGFAPIDVAYANPADWTGTAVINMSGWRKVTIGGKPRIRVKAISRRVES